MRKPTIWVPTRSDTNRPIQSQKMVGGWKFWIQKVEELYYPCSKNKGADQLCSFCEADQIVGFPMRRLTYKSSLESLWISYWSLHYHQNAPQIKFVVKLLKDRIKKFGEVVGVEKKLRIVFRFGLA